MNHINKISINNLGYDFIEKPYINDNEDEYTIRFKQNPDTDFRNLTDDEIAILYSNGNQCLNWKNILIKEDTKISLIQNCSFYGLVRIGNLQPYFLEFKEFKAPIGLYNSKIISCDIGDNVSIQNVKYLSHYIICNDVILANINELSCTNYAKFGNGILKEGEDEKSRIWLELRNENGGRKVIPFDGMLAGDAWLWSKYRDNELLMKSFENFTTHKFSSRRGYYGTIGARTVIKNTLSIKDVKIGSDAYIKGATKLKNLTINSSLNASTQIGESCELVNGIMGEGSKAFYGVKAVRFILQPFSQLKYGARLINSYLGENATISCCEVLNSLIFPAHEQHHNNSFLCASLLMGQTNMAAGATIGSNHNSRGADGEIIAGRGFWPGLCVSLKHNSKFASFNILAKGSYPNELNNPFPFALLSNNEHQNCLEIMPAYWFLHNMYALVRNEQKFISRDKRILKTQNLEYHFLAPDTINEIIYSLQLLEKYTGLYFTENKNYDENEFIEKGKSILNDPNKTIDTITIDTELIENSKRKTIILKVNESYKVYKIMIRYYAALQILNLFNNIENIDFDSLKNNLEKENNHLQEWINVGGQLIKQISINKLIEDCITNKIQDWQGIHKFYEQASATYQHDKFIHSMIILCKVFNLSAKEVNKKLILELIEESLNTDAWILEKIIKSKQKDYQNEFRKMAYDNENEMNAVVGSFEENEFIIHQKHEHDLFKEKIKLFTMNHN